MNSPVHEDGKSLNGHCHLKMAVDVCAKSSSTARVSKIKEKIQSMLCGLRVRMRRVVWHLIVDGFCRISFHQNFFAGS